MLCKNLEPESLVTKRSWKVSLASISFGRPESAQRRSLNEDVREFKRVQERESSRERVQEREFKRERVQERESSREFKRVQERERRETQTSSAVLKDFLDSRARKAQFTTSERGEKA